jgi:hypothetical protein
VPLLLSRGHKGETALRNLIPKTTLGKFAVGFLIGLIALFVIFIVLLATGQPGGDTFEFTPVLIPGILAVLSGVLAFILGLIAIIKNKERSIFVFAAIGVGFMLLVFVVGEFLGPH